MGGLLPMPSLAALLGLVATYGYICLAGIVFVASAGVPLPLQLILISLGALSTQRGGPNFLLLGLVGALTALGGDLVDYLLGRLGGQPALRWFLRKRGRSGTVDQELQRRLPFWRRSGLVILVTRFLLTPLGVPVSLLAGATRLALPRFVSWDLLGEAIFVLGSLALGRLFGASLLRGGPITWAFWGAAAALTLLPLVIVRGVPAVLRRFSREGSATRPERHPSDPRRM
jgi:membrane-associated protein